MTDIESRMLKLARGLSLAENEISAEQVDALRNLGMTIEVREDGNYRLPSKLELFSASRIRGHLSTPANDAISDIECHMQIDSTNTRLMSMPANLAAGRLCLAEAQSAGRGRRGRAWQSPFGENIYMSFGWRIPAGISVSGVSLVVGMAVANSLRMLGYRGIGLKWPNDVLVAEDGQGHRKLAGILLEMGAAPQGDPVVVIGVGVNVAMSEQASEAIDQPYATLRELTAQAEPEAEFSRNRVAAAILDSLIPDLVRYNSEGFAPFAPLWTGFDIYMDQPIVIRIADQQITGVHRGIDEQGQLIAEVNGTRRIFNAGEISLRPSDQASRADKP